jgi:hypothetical protein
MESAVQEQLTQVKFRQRLENYTLRFRAVEVCRSFFAFRKKNQG